MVLGIVIFNITVLLRVLTMNSSCSGMGLAYKTCFSYCCSVAKSCPTLQGPHGLQHTRLPYPLQSPSLLKFISIESVIPSNHLILCHPLLLPSIFPTIRVFSSELVLHIRWPKYWSYSISSFNECSGLISFRIEWFLLLAVQGTLKSLLQQHSSKASILLVIHIHF